MKVKTLNSFPPNSNPFCHDLFRMGISLGTNCTIMVANHEHETCHYLIIVNTETGERVRIDLTDQAEKKEVFGNKVDFALKTGTFDPTDN